MTGEQVYIGYSDKINDPAVQAALNKNKKAAKGFLVIVLIVPIAVTFFIGVKNGNVPDMVAGGVGISAVILVINIISSLLQAGKKQWEGTVTGKRTETHRNNRDEDNISTYYVVDILTNDGKKRKISGTVNPYFDYLNVGDKVRYYPQFNNYYEKYDKSGDSYVFCPVCMTKNNIEDDFCKRCKVPVIK